MSTDDPMPILPHVPVVEGRCGERVRELAADLYEGYIQNSGGLNYQGLPCPKWADLPEAIRGHWCAVACSALGLIGLQVLEVADDRGSDVGQDIAFDLIGDSLMLPEPF